MPLQTLRFPWAFRGASSPLKRLRGLPCPVLPQESARLPLHSTDRFILGNKDSFFYNFLGQFLTHVPLIYFKYLKKKKPAHERAGEKDPIIKAAFAVPHIRKF
jgi:hypothetical protein